MQQAMARQAEAERERRAKIINAEGEFQAAAKLAEAADVISAATRPSCSCATCRRCARSACEQNSTIVFPLPIDLVKPLLDMTSSTPEQAPAELHNGAGAGELPKPQ